MLWAPSRAACSVAPAAVAQFVRPRNSTHTRHRCLAFAVVSHVNSAATAITAAMAYTVERFMKRNVEGRRSVSTAQRCGRPAVAPA